MPPEISYGNHKRIHALPQPPTKRKKPPKLSAAERKEVNTRREAKREAIQQACQEWYQATIKLATEMSARHGAKPEFYVQQLFNHALAKDKNQAVVNPFNAWQADLAERENAGAPLSVFTNNSTELRVYHLA